MKPFNLILILLIITVYTSCKDDAPGYSNISEKKIPKTIDYNFHIRPVLSDKCFICHGPDANKREANLRLDTEEGAYEALEDYSDKFAIVRGKPEESEAYLRMTSQDPTLLMPPPETNLKLNEYELKLIKKWIEQGAEYKQHWAFTPLAVPKQPDVKNSDWPKSELDYFILKKMDEFGLIPNEEADKARLLKRLSFDLTGLPPSLEMQDNFLNDHSKDSYEKIVDQLLASKHYGEKMAVHWMDIARYADSHGYQDDGLRTMWPWRDWVIHAFNENYSFDTFLTWQLAGDLLPKKNIEAILATGFNRNHKITQEAGVIDEEYRIEYVTDRTNTFGKAFLGLTYECAKCHDHKYDPISQKDYYSTFAFFDKVPEKGIYAINATFADPPKMTITDDLIDSLLTFINKKSSYPVEVMVMKDSTDIRKTHILDRGNYDSKGEEVSFDTPESILNFDTEKYNQNRLGLAKWLLSPEHPLTSRVFVNRIWQEFFGKGIVKTSGDFGMQGDLPTHPELLDWLASDFQKDWDIKRLVKNIVMSSTYTQSTQITNSKIKKDPENKFYSRMPRLRLNAEMTRDMVLASSGLLNPEIGGESVKPYQPEGIWEQATSGRGLLREYIQDRKEAIYRRGLYTFIKRTVPPPTMLTFDASNRDQCEVRRLTTSTPLQALVILNDPTVLEAARVLSEKLNGQQLTDEERLIRAFKLIVCRMPKTKERKLLLDYLKDQKEHFTKNPVLAEEYIQVGEYPAQKEIDVIEVASLMQIIHTMYNMEETLTRS